MKKKKRTIEQEWLAANKDIAKFLKSKPCTMEKVKMLEKSIYVNGPLILIDSDVQNCEIHCDGVYYSVLEFCANLNQPKKDKSSKTKTHKIKKKGE